MKKQGFSLVELSIVLVILGLLTGGILTGQNLIRAAELRSVMTDNEKYQTAIQTFRDKYLALPGDMTNATDFWGAAASSNCETTASTDESTCNGNGDGKMVMVVGYSNERFRFWQHLANAGLIEGTYSGVAGASNSYHAIGGYNVPRLRAGNGSIALWYTELTATGWGPKGAHVFILGAERDGNPSAPLFQPEEIWNIDKKIDDGLPGYGNIYNVRSTDSTTPGCTTSDDRNSAQYALSNNANICALYIATGI